MGKRKNRRRLRKIRINFKTAIKNEVLAQMVNTPYESGATTIKLFNEQTSRDPQGFNSAGRIASYLLTYSITAQIWQNHEQISGDILISTQITMQYNDSTILSNNQEEADFWQQLHENATNQLIRRIVYFDATTSTTSSH